MQAKICVLDPYYQVSFLNSINGIKSMRYSLQESYAEISETQGFLIQQGR